MNKKCLHSNPLRRDGTSQQQRTLNTLLPSYVAVDERSMKDLMAFVEVYAEEIQFFDTNNAASGHWADFFKLTNEDWTTFSLEDYLTKLKIEQQTNPHLALFFGFLYMFKVVQDDLNTITERHLNFYYKEVLQLQEQPAQEDKVAVIFELAKHVESHLIKAGTALKAGKDNIGVDVTYTTHDDTVINNTQVAAISSQYSNIHNQLETGAKIPKTDHKIYIAPEAKSADGLGADIESEEKDWRIFSRPTFIKNEDNPSGLKIADRQEGTIGFAIASPNLFLAEGQRKITLQLSIEFPGDEPSPNNNLKDQFSIYLSGEEEWIEASYLDGDYAKLTLVEGEWKIQIAAHLKVDQPPIVAYNNETFGENFTTNWPVIKVLINTDDPNKDSLYKDLIHANIENITLVTEIDGESSGIPGIQNLIIQNDQSVLDAKKPMQIFGNQPHIGSKFLIGSKEIFQKKLDFIHLKFQWVDLPQDSSGFSKYYQHFHVEGTSNNRDNETFKTKIEVLHKKEWELINNATHLFTNSAGHLVSNASQLPNAETKSKLNISGANLNNIDRYTNIQDFDEYTNDLKKGFLRFTLKGTDFGHKDFQNAYTYHAIKIATGATGWVLPNPPHVPAIQDLSIYYKSTVSFNTNSTTTIAEDNNIVEQLFHIEPFGNYEVNKAANTNTLLPTISDEGNLFIGIENLIAPQTLSLLIQIAEGSANPEKEQQEVKWHYLADNKWQPFDQYSILSDTTNGLLTSGIIKLDIPKTITHNNSRLAPNLYWLKASVQNHSDAICDLIDIRAQAISASFSANNNDPKFLEKALPEGSIAKLKNADASIKKVEQPYASSNGKPQEKEKAFYTRVSERLRHKNRAINIWDYEHLILEEFTKVYKVKCINHTQFDGTITNYSESAPGHVSLLIIANVQNKNAVDPLRPKASLAQLSKIEAFIKKINPPCVMLHVKNPIYEEIKVDFKVKFRIGIDAGYYAAKLNEEIKHFLSPWSSDCAKDIVFGGRIHKSVILNFVEERSYVDYVTCFKMYHIVKEDPDNQPNKDTDEAIALTSASIIGSADEHDIEEIPNNAADQCYCDDNIIKNIKELKAIDNC